MIYLAAPYWHDDTAVRAARVAALRTFHAHLVHESTHSFYFNPLANSDGCIAPESYWRAHGIHMMKYAQSVYVLCLDGWMQSVGVKGEIKAAWAERVSVHYFDPNTYKEIEV